MTDQEIQEIIEETVEAFRAKNSKVIVYPETADVGEIVFDAEGVEVSLLWDADDFDGLFTIAMLDRYHMPDDSVHTTVPGLGAVTRERLGQRVFDGHFWAYYEKHGGRATYKMHADRLGTTETLRSFMG